MVDQTPRFELDDFEPGDTNWDHSDLVQFVDEHSIERAPITERPTEGTYPDELYLATDEGILYRWDDDAGSWVVAINSGLSDGEDFDGEGTSSFTNLESVGVDSLQYGERGLDTDFDPDADHFPQPRRGPEASGPPRFKPHPDADNPVLTGDDFDAVVDDFTVEQAGADPFLYYKDGLFYIFCELFAANDEIYTGWATSPDSLTWNAQGNILTSNANSPYGYGGYCMPFRWNGTEYLLNGPFIHESDPDGDWPKDWVQVEYYRHTLPYSGTSIKDPQPFYVNGRWWIEAGHQTDSSKTDELMVWYSEPTTEAPIGLDWTQHPEAPFPGGDGTKRESPGGRPIVRRDGSVYTFYHDNSRSDTMVSCYAITELTTDTYEATEVASSPVSIPWNRNMASSHHIDAMMPAVGGPDIAVTDVGAPWETWILTTADKTYRDRVTASSNGSHTVDGATTTPVPLNNTFEDVDGAFDTTNHEFIVPRSGVWKVNAHVGIDILDDGAKATLSLRDLTADSQRGETVVHTGNGNWSVTPELTTRPRYYAKGARLQVQIRVDGAGGGPFDLRTGNNATYAEFIRVR